MKPLFLSAAIVAGTALVIAPARADSGPVYMNQVKKSLESESAQKHRAPAQEAPTQKSEAAEPSGPVGTQIAFQEITPSIGSMSIAGKSTFSFGTNFSFRVTKSFPAYFEPSVFLSFFNGLNDQNGTLWHIDGGLRFDFAIDNSAIVPFVKGAVGPTLASNSNIVQNNGQKLPDSYLNAFLGGGVKILASSHIAPRLDVGTTLQNGTFGLYVFGSAALPL